MKTCSIIITDKKTGKETTYPSIWDAAKAMRCSPSFIAQAADRGGKVYGYPVRRVDVKQTHMASHSANICFDCQKACGGCSWSEIDPETKHPRFEPILGWTAKPVQILGYANAGQKRPIDTYHITACPEFKPDEPRKSDHRMLTEAQSAHFLENLAKYIKRWDNE